MSNIANKDMLLRDLIYTQLGSIVVFNNVKYIPYKCSHLRECGDKPSLAVVI